MNQDNQSGFFRQYFIACFQPRKYKSLLERRTRSHVGYVILLMIFLLIIDTVIPFGAWMASVGGFQNLFLNRLPAFTLEDGTFDIASPVSFDIGGVIHVEMDSTVESFTQSDFQEKYQEEILISKTNACIRLGNRGSEIKWSSLKNVTLNNQGLTAMIPVLVLLLFIYFLSAFLTKILQYLIIALGFGLICRAGVKSPEGKFVSIKESFLIALYAKTLFAIISSVNICLGYLISSFWVTMISIIIIMSYIYKAEVSVLKPEVS